MPIDSTWPELIVVARMPEGQEPSADESEQFEPSWVRPADALARHAAGSFFMIFPTVRTLQRMASYASVDAVLAACNASRYGLQAGLFTTDVRRIFTAWRELEVGGLVVGGTSGIGEATAILAAKEGAKVGSKSPANNS